MTIDNSLVSLAYRSAYCELQIKT